jgi:hypothetical protein
VVDLVSQGLTSAEKNDEIVNDNYFFSKRATSDKIQRLQLRAEAVRQSLAALQVQPVRLLAAPLLFSRADLKLCM